MSNQPVNLRPRSNSLSLEVNRTHKSAARVLFHDDYQTNNNIEFEGNLKGTNASVQYKSIADVKWTSGGTTAALNDETRLDFKLQEDSVFRLKLKPTSVLGHIDFSQFGWSTQAYSQGLNFWFNPYVQYQTDRSLSNGALFLGLITNVNNGTFSNNARMKLQNKDNDLAGEFENNWTVKYDNFLFNWYYIDNLKDFGKNVSRKLTAEYLNDTLSVSAELDKNTRGNLLDWSLDTLNVGVAYQQNRDLTYGLWSVTDLINDNATTVAAGLHYKAHRDISFKAKADTKQDVSLFANYNWAKGLNLQMSLQSSIDSQRVKNVFNNAFKFGLKLKYDS